MFDVQVSNGKLRGADVVWVRRGSLNDKGKFVKKLLMAFATIEDAAAAADAFFKANCKVKITRRSDPEPSDSLAPVGPRIIITDQFFKPDMNRLQRDTTLSKKSHRIEILTDDPDLDPNEMLEIYKTIVGDSYG